MRKNLSLIFAVLSAIAVITFLLDYEIKPEIKTLRDISAKTDLPLFEAPDFKFTDIENREASLTDFRGKIVILHFWATWCPPCLVEFPKLVKISGDYGQDIVLLAVSSDRESGDVASFAKTNAVSSTTAPNIYMIWDKDRTTTNTLFQTFAYPETIIIDRDGRMARKIPGDVDWTAVEMRSYLETLIGKP